MSDLNKYQGRGQGGRGRGIGDSRASSPKRGSQNFRGGRSRGTRVGN